MLGWFRSIRVLLTLLGGLREILNLLRGKGLMHGSNPEGVQATPDHVWEGKWQEAGATGNLDVAALNEELVKQNQMLLEALKQLYRRQRSILILALLSFLLAAFCTFWILLGRADAPVSAAPQDPPAQQAPYPHAQ